ncbi:MAG: Lrp/AsnC family transcriptional regulator [Thermoplasmatales archaeon]|nr:MAG: Lrp/AsnC family transcriptional regulator [Thermoplasmatales archaeon]
MPKSSKKQINEDEKMLLKVLQTSSGDNIENIAKKCGFTRQKVWRIKKRLEKDKTIWGYSAVFDEERVGLKKYIILLKRTNKPISPEKLQIPIKGVAKRELAKMGIEIDFNLLVHGDYDLALCASTKGVKELVILTNNLNKMFGEYIAEMLTLEVLFPIQNCGIDNPNLEKLKEFFISE